MCSSCSWRSVAPYAGAWIEIEFAEMLRGIGFTSLPTRERGLKLVWVDRDVLLVRVAPYAGAWIEI